MLPIVKGLSLHDKQEGIIIKVINIKFIYIIHGVSMSKLLVYIKIMINFILIILLVLIGIFVVPRLIRFFMPFVIGWIIAMIANPLVRFLEKKVKIIRKFSSALIIIVVILAVLGAIYGVVAVGVRELRHLSSDIPNIYGNILSSFNELSEKLDVIYVKLPESLKLIIDNIKLSLSEYATNVMSNENIPTISTAGNFAKNIAEWLLGIIITILSAYFFIAERDNLVRDLKKIMPQMVLTNYNLVASNFKTAVGGYFKAQFKIMLIIVGILFLGFEILRVDYSFLLALGIAFLDFLPFFGTGLILWPWAVIDFLLGNYFRAISLVVIYLICQVVKQVLQPKMVGDSIGISPLATLVFMYIGYRFMGVLGMIIGIPIGMVIINFYRIGMFDTIIRGLKIIIEDLNNFRKF